MFYRECTVFSFFLWKYLRIPVEKKKSSSQILDQRTKKFYQKFVRIMPPHTAKSHSPRCAFLPQYSFEGSKRNVLTEHFSTVSLFPTSWILQSLSYLNSWPQKNLSQESLKILEMNFLFPKAISLIPKMTAVFTVRQYQPGFRFFLFSSLL